MNREIKFRGLDINKEWQYGSLIIKHNPHKKEPEIWAALIHNHALSVVAVNPETVGEYTGLQDKNGKDIYEGDILYCIGGQSDKWTGCKDPKCKLKHNRKLFVAWHDGCFWLKTQKKRGKKWRLDGKIIHQNSLVVFGNIHENQELLK